MRYAALILAGLVLAACGAMQREEAVVFAPDREASFVGLVEQSGCRVDPADHEPIHAAGFTDAEISAIGGDLVSKGRAEFAPDGALILLTGTCL